MLNLMSQFPLAQYSHNSADALQVMIEAKKLAYADLRRYVGDPRDNKIPIDGLLSVDYARNRAKLIEMSKSELFGRRWQSTEGWRHDLSQRCR